MTDNFLNPSSKPAETSNIASRPRLHFNYSSIRRKKSMPIIKESRKEQESPVQSAATVSFNIPVIHIESSSSLSSLQEDDIDKYQYSNGKHFENEKKIRDLTEQLKAAHLEIGALRMENKKLKKVIHNLENETNANEGHDPMVIHRSTRSLDI